MQRLHRALSRETAAAPWSDTSPAGTRTTMGRGPPPIKRVCGESRGRLHRRDEAGGRGVPRLAGSFPTALSEVGRTAAGPRATGCCRVGPGRVSGSGRDPWNDRGTAPMCVASWLLVVMLPGEGGVGGHRLERTLRAPWWRIGCPLPDSTIQHGARRSVTRRTKAPATRRSVPCCTAPLLSVWIATCGGDGDPNPAARTAPADQKAVMWPGTVGGDGIRSPSWNEEESNLLVPIGLSRLATAIKKAARWAAPRGG